MLVVFGLEIVGEHLGWNLPRNATGSQVLASGVSGVPGGGGDFLIAYFVSMDKGSLLIFELNYRVSNHYNSAPGWIILCARIH